MKNVRTESHPEYSSATVAADADAIIARAIAILSERLPQTKGEQVTSPRIARKLAWILCQSRDPLSETFGVIYLTTQHVVLAAEIASTGTIDGASVHPREIVRRALSLGASAVICCHNHPSGVPTPSPADEVLTSRLRDALALIDVRLLDHIVCGSIPEESVSMAEHGLV